MLLPRIVPMLIVPSLLVGSAVAIGAAPSDAIGQGRLRARVFLVQHQLPRRGTERALLSFSRRNNARRLRETSDVPIPERQWKAEMITAFSRPPGDLEFHVLFYDVEDGARRFVSDMSTFVNDRSQRTFVQRLRLDRGRGHHDGFQPNRRMELVVTIRRQEVGRARFELLGEELQRSGTVDFSDDER